MSILMYYYGMKKIHKLADDFRIKFAQQYQIREYPMGNPKNPSLENMVNNIQVLIRGFNALSAQGVGGQVNQILQRLQQLGIQFNS